MKEQRKVLDDRMKELTKLCADLDQQIDELSRQRGAIYKEMRDLAVKQGEIAEKLPAEWGAEDHHVMHARRCGYLSKHQDECGHGVISYELDDPNPYGKCNDCGKNLTKEDHDHFIDI